jgi:hypothetical protein
MTVGEREAGDSETTETRGAAPAEPKRKEPSPSDAAPEQPPPDAAADKRFRLAAVACFTLALVLRVYFVRKVQDPGDAIVSDMQRYFNEAADIVLGRPEPPLTAVCKPPGAAWLFALQMKLFGLKAYHPMALVQALFGAGAPVFSMLAARRIFRAPGLTGPLAVGLTVALWQPLLVFTGYFSSEVPFAFLLTLALWLWIRLLQTGKGALAAGVVTALAYPIRPQIALTVALVVGLVLLSYKRFAFLGLRKAALFVAPVALSVLLCAGRYHHITGEIGLISNNNAVMSFFASTNYQGVLTVLPQKDGTMQAAGFQPPPRTASEGFDPPFKIEGQYCDPRPLVQEKARILAQTPLTERLFRIGRNISYLAYRNPLWPESIRASTGVRHTLLVAGRYAGAYLLVPLSLAGLALLAFRRNLGLEVAAMHILALLYTAAFYFGEQRYRVPYDPVLILLAVYAILVALKIEPKAEGEAPKPWVKYSVLGGIAALVLLQIVSWAARA